jgi:hypothetical protein
VYRKYDSRGVAIVWLLQVPLYGEADAGGIFHRTLRKQLVQKQLFSQSEYDPCYFWKVLSDGSWLNLTIHVDDAFITDDRPSRRRDRDIACGDATEAARHT